jgi:hypothetical protein
MNIFATSKIETQLEVRLNLKAGAKEKGFLYIPPAR